jgi:sec-independent protein translocase protein TatB
VIEGAEYFVILLVALVVLGPERLPDLARRLGRWTSELRRAAGELRQGLEAEIGDVREVASDIRQPLREVEQTMNDTRRMARDARGDIDSGMGSKAWVGPKPVSGPTPEDAMRDLEEINASGEALEDAPAEHRPEPKPWVGPKPLPDTSDDQGGAS